MNDPIYQAWLFKVNQILYSLFLHEAHEITSKKRVIKLFKENKTPKEVAEIIFHENEDYLLSIIELIDFDNTVNGGGK